MKKRLFIAKWSVAYIFFAKNKVNVSSMNLILHSSLFTLTPPLHFIFLIPHLINTADPLTNTIIVANT